METDFKLSLAERTRQRELDAKYKKLTDKELVQLVCDLHGYDFNVRWSAFSAHKIRIQKHLRIRKQVKVWLRHNYKKIQRPVLPCTFCHSEQTFVKTSTPLAWYMYCKVCGNTFTVRRESVLK